MTVSEVARLGDDALRRGLCELVVHDRTTTVRLLIHMAEFDSRGLYRAEGYDSMYRYCVGELRMSEEIAYKRIRTARKARRFPSIYVGLASGELSVSTIVMLSRYLSQDNADDLLKDAKGKSKAQVEELIATRFPRPDLPTLVQAVTDVAAQPIGISALPLQPPACQELSPGTVAPPAAQAPDLRPKVTPLAPQRYGVQFTIGGEDRELLERAKALLSHRIPAADEGQIFVHALRALVGHLEKRKFGSTDKPREHSARDGGDPRYIPAQVRRVVAQRDGEQCTFVAPGGRRCEARGFLEFDHIEPVARGGRATIANLRLRCRAHNCHAAEQTYGRDLVRAKIEARRAAAG